VKTPVCQLFEFTKKRFTDFSLQYKGALTTNSDFLNSVHRLFGFLFVCLFVSWQDERSRGYSKL